MIFIANNLVMNGGSTFLLRACKELKNQNQKCAVLILRKQYSESLKKQLEEYATLFFLPDFLYIFKYFFIGHLSIFSPINHKKLNAALSPYPQNFHIMGAFGLILAYRLFNSSENRRFSVGIYHQNEFLYQSANLFFPRFIQILFQKINPKSIIFFNKKTKDNYSKFYSRSYEESIIAPIGIEIKKHVNLISKEDISFRFVSVGNLNVFKTYNSHMIDVVSNLIKKYPKITYHIYGDGEQYIYLKNKISSLQLERVVFLEGVINYDQFDNILKDTCLFIGSGTSLLEAAILGIPSLIGIESIMIPKTYGFLSNIDGYDYNEYSEDRKLFDIELLIDNLLSDINNIKKTGGDCQIKAHEFSILKTIYFLNESFYDELNLPHRLKYFELARLFFSFLILFILEKLNLVTKFSTRRNQSYF